jgi:hypothetical protein
MKILLSIDRCPRHGFNAVSVSGNSKIGGTRLTPSKCCGSWKQVQAWDVDVDRLLEDIKSEVACIKPASPQEGGQG